MGIGTASPASTLDVGNQFKFITSSQSGNNSGDTLFQIGSTAAGRWSRITGSSTTSSLAFWGDNLGNVAGNSNPHLVISGAAATKGNIGIGVGSEAPTAKLHIKTNTGGSGFKLVDGTQGNDKVLTSNADGNASWQSASAFIPSAKPTVTGTLRTANGNQRARSYTSVANTRITLSAGRWLVYIGQMITSSSPSSQENNGWIRFTLSEKYDPNNATSANLVKTNFTMPTATGNGFALVSANTSSMNSSGVYYSFASGVILVEVTPPAGATTVTLSLNFESNLYRGTIITEANTFVSNNRENYFFAVPIN